MRKNLVKALAVLAGVSTLTGSALAWRGSGMGMGMGPCGGYYPPFLVQQDPQQLPKFQSFLRETLPLRQKLLQMREELMELYTQPHPNWEAITKKRQEIVALQVEIQKRAQNYGLPYFGLPGGLGRKMKGTFGGPWW
ncbi:MAG: hypothetical protein RMI74_04895 [Thermodesulfobacterium sp.]|nr:hypothetical protein [Thermodesulfobacterium sp.]